MPVLPSHARADDLTQPRRTHPFGIVADLASFAFATIYFFVLDGTYFGLVERGGRFEPFELVLSALLLAAGVIKYLRRRFYVADGKVVLESGVLTRSIQRVEVSDIQTVSSRTSRFHGWLGLTELTLHESSGRSKMTLAPLKSDVAAELEALLNEQEGSDQQIEFGVQPARDDESPDTREPEARPLENSPIFSAAMARSDLLRLGLVQFTAAAVVFVPLIVVLSRWNVYVSVVAAALIVVASLGGLAERLSFRFQAFRSHLRLSTGILTHQSKVVSLANIQAVKVARGPLRRVLGLEKVESVIAGTTTDLPTMLASAWPLGTWPELVRHVVPELEVDETDLEPISRRSVRRMRLRLLLASSPMLLLALVAPWIVPGVAACAAAMIWWYPRRRLARFGIAKSPTLLIVRSGVFLEQLQLLPLARVEYANVTESFGQRRHGLATLRLSAAGDDAVVNLPDLDAEVAMTWLAFLSQESHRRSGQRQAVAIPFDTGAQRIDPAAMLALGASSFVEFLLVSGFVSVGPWVLSRFDIYDAPSALVWSVAGVLFAIWTFGVIDGFVRCRTLRWRATDQTVETEMNFFSTHTLSLVKRSGVLSHSRTSSFVERKLSLNRLSLRTVGGSSPDLDLQGLNDRDVATILVDDHDPDVVQQEISRS